MIRRKSFGVHKLTLLVLEQKETQYFQKNTEKEKLI